MNRYRKLIHLLFYIFFAALIGYGLYSFVSFYFKPNKKVALNAENIMLYVGDAYPLQGEYQSKNIVYSVNNENVATIDRETGVVIAKKAGKATLFARVEDDTSIYSEANIEVINPSSNNSKIIVNDNKVNFKTSGVKRANISIGNINTSRITYRSKDESIAIVDDNGLIIPRGKGTTQIEVLLDNGNAQIIDVNVENDDAVIDVSDNNTTVTDLAEVIAASNPETKKSTSTNSNSKTNSNTSNKNTNSNTNKNNNTGTNNNTTNNNSNTNTNNNNSTNTNKNTNSNTSTKKNNNSSNNNNNLNQSGSGTSTNKKSPTTNSNDPTVNTGARKNDVLDSDDYISLSQQFVTLNVNKTVTLDVLYSFNAIGKTNLSPKWSSADPRVATVSQTGTIKGIAPGSTIVSVTYGNKTAIVKVDVLFGRATVEVSQVKVDKSIYTVLKGSSVPVYHSAIPDNADDKTLTWISTDPSIAIVKDDKIYGLQAGETVVNVRANNGVGTSFIVTVKDIPANTSEMRASMNLLVSKAGDGYYAYAPSVFIETDEIASNLKITSLSSTSMSKKYYGSTAKVSIFSCQNKDNYQTVDHVFLNDSDGRYQILTPQTGWDSFHICDPSIVKGNFKYQGISYKYVMAYLGVDNASCVNNKIGLAVSNNLKGGWVKVGNTPFINSTSNGRWGAGQPSLIYVNNKLIMFYTNDTGSGSPMEVRIINPDGFGIIGSVGLSTANTSWMHNADFAYKGNRLYVAYEGDEALRTHDIISDTIQIKSAYISDYGNLNSYKNLSWETENVVSSSVSGSVRNTNAGLFKDSSGGLYSRNVAFTKTDSGLGTGHYTYNIYYCSF